jgi:hypothetical protein
MSNNLDKCIADWTHWFQQKEMRKTIVDLIHGYYIHSLDPSKGYNFNRLIEIYDIKKVENYYEQEKEKKRIKAIEKSKKKSGNGISLSLQMQMLALKDNQFAMLMGDDEN